MTAREFIVKKLNKVSENANKVDTFFVVTFWNAPKELGGSLDCKVAYFESFLDMESYYDFQIQERGRVGLPYQVFSSDNSFYTKDFYNEVDRTLSDFNIKNYSL